MLREAYRKHRKLILFIIIASALLLIFYSSILGLNRFTQGIYHSTLAPMHKAMDQWRRNREIRQATIKEFEAIKQDLIDAQEKLLEQETRREENAILKTEILRLKQLLDYQNIITYSNIVAPVIAKNPENLYRTLIIGKGLNAGIQTNQVVMGFTKGKAALVGKIIEVGPVSSRVLTINDSQCQVSIYVSENKNNAILKGMAPLSQNAQIQFLDRNIKNIEGMDVLSSGLGDVFPEGIYIGNISETIKKRYGLFQEAIVVPHVDFSSIRDVFILIPEN